MDGSVLNSGDHVLIPPTHHKSSIVFIQTDPDLCMFILISSLPLSALSCAHPLLVPKHDSVRNLLFLARL